MTPVSFLRFTGLLLFCGLMSACTPKEMAMGAGKMAMILWDPTQPLGPPKDHPSTVNVSLYAEPDVNVTDFGQAPVQVWIYQLSGEDELIMADFATLTSSPKDVLSTSYVDMKMKLVAPGGSAVLPSWKLDEDTRMLGVVVGYAAISNGEPNGNGSGSRWRGMTHDEYRMMVALKKEGLIENADWQKVEKLNFEGEQYDVYRPVPLGEGTGPVVWRTFEKVNAKGEEYNVVIPIRARSVSIQVHR